jgi:Tol biopolymer transport system component
VISKFLLAVGLAILMAVTGVTSYVYLGSRQSKVVAPPQKPTAASLRAQAFPLPGTIYLAQSGALYSFGAGRFHQLTSEAGWTQPALSPDGLSLLAVKRSSFFSDVYLLTPYGSVVSQLTNNAAPPRSAWDPGANAWSFYPRLSPDQHTLWMSYDGPKYVGANYFDVDMAVWAVPLGAQIRQGRAWTTANNYTGGDVQPVPVPGGIMYTKYTYDENGNRVGQLWFTNRAGSAGRALTSTGAGCLQPSISPDGGELAMICTFQKQVSYLTIASWNGSSLGALQTVISDQLVAEPIWAPDGSGIAYLAPGGPAAPFQLWFLPKNAYAPPPPSPIPTPIPTPGGPHNGPLPSPTPSPAPVVPVVKPIQVTFNLGFDATSPLAWLG